MRLVFAGTPVFAQCALEALAQAGHEIALVLTRPDKPAARGHKLVASHSVVMDPAYVHITRASMAEHARLSSLLRERGVHSVGRYGGWTYCAIEDNIVEARSLVGAWT